MGDRGTERAGEQQSEVLSPGLNDREGGGEEGLRAGLSPGGPGGCWRRTEAPRRSLGMDFAGGGRR